MYGALPAGFYLDYAKSVGAYYQLPLIKTPPKYEIKEEYLTSVPKGVNIVLTDTGSNYSTLTHIDHPYFTATREHLGSNGYIEIQDRWINGDRVLKEFYLNDVLFEEGDKFPCAPAMKLHLEFKEEYVDSED